MTNRSQRVAEAAQARDARLLQAWLEAHPPTTCGNCGRPLPTVLPGAGATGRTRIWCSNACRQKGYRARKATPRNAAEAHVSPEPSTATMFHSLDECIVTVLNEPEGVAAVLDVARQALRDGVLDQPQYADVQTALLALADQMAAPPR